MAAPPEPVTAPIPVVAEEMSAPPIPAVIEETIAPPVPVIVEEITALPEIAPVVPVEAFVPVKAAAMPKPRKPAKPRPKVAKPAVTMAAPAEAAEPTPPVPIETVEDIAPMVEVSPIAAESPEPVAAFETAPSAAEPEIIVETIPPVEIPDIVAETIVAAVAFPAADTLQDILTASPLFKNAPILVTDKLEALVHSSSAATAGIEALALEMTEFGLRQFDEAFAAWKGLMRSNSPIERFQTQCDYARNSLDGMLEEGSKVTFAMMRLAREVVQPAFLR